MCSKLFIQAPLMPCSSRPSASQSPGVKQDRGQQAERQERTADRTFRREIHQGAGFGVGGDHHDERYHDEEDVRPLKGAILITASIVAIARYCSGSGMVRGCQITATRLPTVSIAMATVMASLHWRKSGAPWASHCSGTKTKVRHEVEGCQGGQDPE